MSDRVGPGDVPADEGACTESWLGGLLFRALSLPEGLSVDQEARERGGARAQCSCHLPVQRTNARAAVRSYKLREINAIDPYCLHLQLVRWQRPLC